jgi:3-deoxy-D-manno-octulosonate 8-phosphate phosphatase KdsC-like HAD superfamily phosphatase
LARSSAISSALKKRAANVQLILMDVDGTMTDGSVTLLSQSDGTALEIKTFDAHEPRACAQAASPAVKVRHSFAALTK